MRGALWDKSRTRRPRDGVMPDEHERRNDALDGLRLLAVAAVMAFHFGVPQADGGFLGVDVFFVLSGFLITRVLLRQVERRRVDLASFWTRRARRLAPALLLGIGAVIALGGGRRARHGARRPQRRHHGNARLRRELASHLVGQLLRGNR